MKNMKLLVYSIGLIVFIHGCSNDNSDKNITQNEENKVYVNQCTDNDDESTYTEILVGDILKNEAQDTQVKIVHDEDDVKLICTLEGKAYIIR